MNERIKELKTKAFDAVWDLDNDPVGPLTHFTPDGFEEKFAELIVRECIKIIYEQERVPKEFFYPKGAGQHELAIKQHFGLEE